MRCYLGTFNLDGPQTPARTRTFIDQGNEEGGGIASLQDGFIPSTFFLNNGYFFKRKYRMDIFISY